MTLRSVGSSGGQAAAFTFDLARSVVYTRQGNPAWAGQERDGVSGIRPDDLFYGAKAGDVQPDWLDTNKIAIPQADEQQRLLVNLITLMERDKLPLPRFWYLPRGKKAVVVMSGDDHSPTQAPGGTASNFDRFKALSPAGLLGRQLGVRALDRRTSIPTATLTNAQAAGVPRRRLRGRAASGRRVVPDDADHRRQSSPRYFDTQLALVRRRSTRASRRRSRAAPTASTGPTGPRTRRSSSRTGSGWTRNYYHYPAAWIGDKPGFMNGGGFPMRFADLDGTHDRRLPGEHEHDRRVDAGISRRRSTRCSTTRSARRATTAPSARTSTTTTRRRSPDAEAIVASAQARGVPVISYKQLLDWIDGRNNSTIRGLSWNAGTFTFVTTVGAGANGLQTMLPTQGPTGTLSALTLRRLADDVHRADDQGHPVRDVRHHHRHLPGDVLLSEQRPHRSARHNP